MSAVGLRASRPAYALFVLPFVALYAALLIWPLLKGVFISFHDHDLLSNESFWVGLANYAELWNDEVFRQVIWNTIRFVAISTPIFVILSLALALALNRPGKLAFLLRATFFCASVFSVTLVTLVWKLALMPGRGLLPQMLTALGLPELPLLTDENLALLTVALITVWWIIGLPMILFLSALQQIPAELYEAAALDNASRWRTLTQVTLPTLKRAIVLVALIELIRQFQVFPQILLMTNGGPNNSTRPIVQFIYEQAFMQLSLGYATAASQILLAIMLVGGVGADLDRARHEGGSGMNPLLRRGWFDRLLMAGLCGLALIWMLPLLWVLALSFKPNEFLMARTDVFLAPPYTLDNYLDILGTSAVFRWLGNSALVALLQTAGVLVLSSLAGYGFARCEFPGRRWLFAFVLFGLAVPAQSVFIPLHHQFTAWGLQNTHAGLILPGLAAPFGVYLMTQYFKAIPLELEEAALLDNASRLKTFVRVILPLSLPAQATLGIFTFLACWNDYLWPLVIATQPDMYTLTRGLASTQTNFAQSEGLGFLMAQAVFAGAPVLMLYLFFQKHLVSAVSSR
jgi:ABC-type glycerol-3-phosphate transport system permease component